MRDWDNICDTGFFNDYEEECMETIKENIDEFREYAFLAVRPYMRYDETNGVHIFYFFKNVIYFGLKYFLSNTLLKTDPWWKDQWSRYEKIVYGDKPCYDYDILRGVFPEEYYNEPDYSDYEEEENMFVDTYDAYSRFYY